MKSKWKRFLGGLLTATLLITIFPTAAFANSKQTEYPVELVSNITDIAGNAPAQLLLPEGLKYVDSEGSEISSLVLNASDISEGAITIPKIQTTAMEEEVKPQEIPYGYVTIDGVQYTAECTTYDVEVLRDVSVNNHPLPAAPTVWSETGISITQESFNNADAIQILTQEKEPSDVLPPNISPDNVEWGDTQLRIRYNWTLRAYTAQYDLWGDLRENAIIYAAKTVGDIENSVYIDYTAKITKDTSNIKCSIPDGKTMVVAPIFQVGNTYHVADLIAYDETSDQYYELLGWKFKDSADNTIYKWGEEIPLDKNQKDLEFTAVWNNEPIDIELDTSIERPEIPLANQYGDTETDAKITQKGSDGNWTTAQLQLGEDRTISYKATLEMSYLVAQVLANQAIKDPNFANFDITVQFDKNLVLQANNDEDVTFNFKCTFLKPTGQIIVNDGTGTNTYSVKVKEEDQASTYTFTIPASYLNGKQSFTIPVQWLPTDTGYDADELQEEIQLETMNAVMAEGAEVVKATGAITGNIDFAYANTIQHVNQGYGVIAALPQWTEYLTNGEDRPLDIVDIVRMEKIIKDALDNITLDANTVVATVATPEAPIVNKTATALNNNKTNVTLQVTAGSAISSGFVTDIIGDDFELTDRTALDADTFTLTVNGTKQTAVVDPQNPMQVHFGTSGENGQYPYTVIYAPATETVKEQLVWKIDDGIAKDETLTLSYSLDLVNKASTQGTHVVPTNENAQLDYTLLGGATGTAEFPVPTVSYTVSGGGGVHHPDYDPDKDDEPADEPEEDIPEEEVPLAETPWLNTVDHYAYIVGYPEDYVTGQPTEDESRWPIKPQANITRAEVATIFFRLLTDEARDQFWMTTNDFPDVAADAWYNNAISTMVNAGIIQGYEDGTFRPNDNITRAEFAAIASRFMSSGYDVEEDLFTDISGHWARENINDAAMTKWINGYPDGTFLPDNDITRAEAVTLVNNVLRRAPDADHMLDSMIKWPDNMDTSAWYYEAMQEATNSHDYDMFEGAEYETWTALEENRDWAALEQDWMNAHRGGGEVM